MCLLEDLREIVDFGARYEVDDGAESSVAEENEEFIWRRIKNKHQSAVL